MTLDCRLDRLLAGLKSLEEVNGGVLYWSFLGSMGGLCSSTCLHSFSLEALLKGTLFYKFANLAIVLRHLNILQSPKIYKYVPINMINHCTSKQIAICKIRAPKKSHCINLHFTNFPLPYKFQEAVKIILWYSYSVSCFCSWCEGACQSCFLGVNFRGWL